LEEENPKVALVGEQMEPVNIVDDGLTEEDNRNITMVLNLVKRHKPIPQTLISELKKNSKAYEKIL